MYRTRVCLHERMKVSADAYGHSSHLSDVFSNPFSVQQSNHCNGEWRWNKKCTDIIQKISGYLLPSLLPIMWPHVTSIIILGCHSSLNNTWYCLQSILINPFHKTIIHVYAAVFTLLSNQAHLNWNSPMRNDFVNINEYSNAFEIPWIPWILSWSFPCTISTYHNQS